MPGLYLDLGDGATKRSRTTIAQQSTGNNGPAARSESHVSGDQAPGARCLLGVTCLPFGVCLQLSFFGCNYLPAATGAFTNVSQPCASVFLPLVMSKNSFWITRVKGPAAPLPIAILSTERIG